LDFHAILGLGTNVWRVLWSRRLDVIATLRHFCDVVRLADGSCAVGVVPISVQADVEIPWPVNGYGVLLLQNINEVLGVILPNVLYAKIVDDKTEGDGTCLVCEEARRVGRLNVATCLEVDDEVIAGKDSGLRETIHTFVDITVDKAIDCS
jgi:hypothetical protein